MERWYQGGGFTVATVPAPPPVPADEPGKERKDGPPAGDSITHVADVDGDPGTWLQPGPTPVSRVSGV